MNIHIYFNISFLLGSVSEGRKKKVMPFSSNKNIFPKEKKQQASNSSKSVHMDGRKD